MKLKSVVMLLCALLFRFQLIAGASEVIYECDFSAEEVKAWSMGDIGTIEQENGESVLKVVANPQKVHNKVTMKIDVKPYAGKIIKMICRTKFKGVTKPKHSYNGTKFMLSYTRENGTKKYCHPSPGETGDSDWHDVVHFAPIEKGATGGLFSLGLEESNGEVWFDKIKLEAIDLTDAYPQVAPAGYMPEYTDRVLKEPRRRGAMSPSKFTEKTLTKDIPDLRSWGANLIRWQLIRNWGKKYSDQDTEEYLQWVQARIPEIKQVLDKAIELDMKVVLDLHVPPGGRRPNGEMNMFYEERFVKAFKEAWRKLATAVKGHPALYGYDLINEPTQNPGAKIDYLTLQYDVARIVRAIDPDTPIIVESNRWDSPSTYHYFGPMPMKDVIYQVHMYAPGSYTHQGVHNHPIQDEGYPGKFEDRDYDKEMLRKVLCQVREFQLKYKARIYVGEFSAIRWAKGADRYLNDCIELFEEYGWDWSYHAFREWSGWSVEHSTDKNITEAVNYDTARKKVLLKYYKLNGVQK